LASVNAVFASRVKIGDLYYLLNTTDQTAEVTYKLPEGIVYNEDTSITQVVIPAFVTYNDSLYSVTSIGSYAFYFCTSLTSVTIPNGVTTIGDCAFAGCNGLTSLTIPVSVTSIGGNAFDYLPNINYDGTAAGSPWGAKYLNGYVDGWLVYNDESKTDLAACSTKATGEIIISDSVIRISNNAFIYCRDLTSVVLGENVTSIGDCAFKECENLTSVTMNEGVLTIGSGAFCDCYRLTDITMSSSLTSIDNNAFSNCSSLSSIEIPDGVTRIGKWAFEDSGLDSIIIPSSVAVIDQGAFYMCNDIQAIYNYATTPQTITADVFGSHDFLGVKKSLCVLYVPEESVNLYRTADVWGEFVHIIGITEPQPTTGMEPVNSQRGVIRCQKEIRDGHIYLRRGDKRFTVTGQVCEN